MARVALMKASHIDRSCHVSIFYFTKFGSINQPKKLRHSKTVHRNTSKEDKIE